MTDRTYDLQGWLETYKDTFTSFARAQQAGFKALERFAHFNYAVAGDFIEASLEQTRAALGVRAAVGTQAVAELLQKQAEIGTQLSEKLKARAKEFSALAGDVQDTVGSLAADAAAAASRAAGPRKAAA